MQILMIIVALIVFGCGCLIAWGLFPTEFMAYAQRGDLSDLLSGVLIAVLVISLLFMRRKR